MRTIRREYHAFATSPSSCSSAAADTDRVVVGNADRAISQDEEDGQTYITSIGGIMSNRNDYNRQVIKEFRANGGKVSGPWENTPLLLLTTTGAKSGECRITPMGYLPDGDCLIVIASNGGASTRPDWYHNLVAHPEVTVEVGTETFDAIAVVTENEERNRLWTKAVELYPHLAEYQAKTTHQISVISLSRQAR